MRETARKHQKRRRVTRLQALVDPRRHQGTPRVMQITGVLAAPSRRRGVTSQVATMAVRKAAATLTGLDGFGSTYRWRYHETAEIIPNAHRYRPPFLSALKIPNA
jgi:hypothetical protein